MLKEARGPTDAPRFCPRCLKARDSDGAICRECGEHLESQGHCPTCETFWPIAVGEPCPKHDLPLGPPPRDEPVWPAGVPFDWVTLQSYPHPIAADAARLRLEAEGIPTFLAGARMAESVLYQVATGGVKLQVPRTLLADARVLLAQSWAPPFADDDDEDWDDGIIATEVVIDEEERTTSWTKEVWIGLWVFLLALLLATIFFWPSAR